MSVVAVFVTVCLVYDWRKNRVVHPVFAIVGVVLILLWPARYAVARSEVWQPIGEWIAEVAGTFSIEGARIETPRSFPSH